MSAKVFTHMKPPSCAIRLEESYGFFSCFISDEIRHPPWGMLRVFRPEAEEERERSSTRGAVRLRRGIQFLPENSFFLTGNTSSSHYGDAPAAGNQSSHQRGLIGEELIRVLRNRLIERSEMKRKEELIRVLRTA